jgi:hypothetical protein
MSLGLAAGPRKEEARSKSVLLSSPIEFGEDAWSEKSKWARR